MTDVPERMPLTRDFFDRPVVDVAPDLLGRTLLRNTPDGPITLRLTEVEAYDGETDPGSHAYRGRTARNAAMFGPPGHAYVYFIYGMWFSLNVVCGPEGKASGVLLRAGEILTGTPWPPTAAPRHAAPTNWRRARPAWPPPSTSTAPSTAPTCAPAATPRSPCSTATRRPRAGTQRPTHRRRRRRCGPPLALLDRRRPHRQPLPPPRPPPPRHHRSLTLCREPPNVARAAGDGQRYLRRPPGGTTNYSQRLPNGSSFALPKFDPRRLDYESPGKAAKVVTTPKGQQ